MEKLYALFNLFRKGDAVANPEQWKNGAVGVSALIPLLLAIDRVAKSFGVELGIDTQTAADISVGVLGIIGVCSHVIANRRIGLPAKK